ncbi:huntingtin interacting protein 1 [Holotrichia oblita]|uniref:Huntingtin interacting protein 1 n=1 Tax=Holotrichia oblita TaxID=644536 RepID=A0ACB9T2G3_HOLOL|nr:huntingtin interacting protein 1 [Holotrichia oblita]
MPSRSGVEPPGINTLPCQKNIAITKAINAHEVPVKQKHVRSAIIGTFQQQGGHIFWSIALRLPTLDDRIVAWKFCHVLHKVLREGHPLCLVHSQRHRNELDEMGKLWGHLKEGYGKLIRLYTTLLMTKLDFHRRNPRFPGHLGVTQDELESIGSNDINNYFEMSIEMFDYLDAILELQFAIFGSLDMSRSNSMTSAGQCRLAPLIPCIQDASKLYDYCVKLLFKLHSSLPPDTLQGHRDRFLKQFKQLRQFYQNTNALQYFKDLITVPPLPDSPPDFLIQANLHTYVTQEVIVPAEEEEPPSEGNLIDTSEVSVDRTDSQQSFVSPSPSQIELLAERDNLIKHLQSETERLRSEINRVVNQKQKDIITLQDQITSLETELATKDSELVQERQIKEDLFHQASAVAQTQDSEQKARDEKFNKIKDLYVKLREEHIQLLRQKADIEKKLNVGYKKVEDLEMTNSQLETQFRELKMEHSLQTEKIQQSSAEQTDELNMLRKDKELFHMETEVLKKSVEDAFREKNIISDSLRVVVLEKEQLNNDIANLSVRINDLQDELKLLTAQSVSDVKIIVHKSLSEGKSVISSAIHEIDNPALAAVSCSPDYFKSLTDGCLETLEAARTVSYSQPSEIVSIAIRLSHRHATFLLQGRATSNSSPDITFGDKMADECKKLGQLIVDILERLSEEIPVADKVEETKQQLESVTTLAETLSGSLKATPEDLADMIEREMAAMDGAIEEAAKRIEDMLSKSRQADSGIKLEVNEKILDSCTTLMAAIRVLIQKSRLLQAEIVAQGKGTAGAKEFYKRNHQWTDGFISAAKAVAVAAKFLLGAADKVISGQGKLEHLVVGAQEIAASTAQLVVASRVKADRKSHNLEQLSQASKGVTNATGGVVATVKDCSQLMDEAELDTSNLTLHQAKRFEMDAQVRVLELEKELEQERLRLSALRRHHYQLAGEGEGWVVINN